MMNHKHLFGFDNEKELIYIFKGYDFLNLTSSITEYFEKSPAQYTKHWGWYINDLNKIKDLPNNIVPIKLEWKDVCKNETELRDDIDTYINELLYGVSNSDFIGEIGQRLDIEATLIKAKEVESNYGNGHFYVFEDFSGNQMIWTTTARVLEVGVVYKFRGTIKALNEYRGIKQTVLTNCRFSRS